MAALDDLLGELFGEERPAFYGEVAGWLRGSRRFQAFAAEYRTKIRAKVRRAGDEEALLDVRAELQAAALLLQEARFAVAYETYAALKQRGPDFTVTFKTHTPFNVEVRRIRSRELEDGESDVRMGKLLAVLGDKVRQMPPGIANLLWLVAEDGLGEAGVGEAAAALRQLGERKDEAFFTRRGYKSAADFLKQVQRLSGVAIQQPGGVQIWLNPLARHGVPPAIVNALKRLEV